MDRYQLACLVLCTLTCCAEAQIQRYHRAVLGMNRGAAGAGPSYLIQEGFEGTGYEQGGWVEAGVTPPDEDYTGTGPLPVLAGSQSWFGDINNARAYKSIPASAEVWAYFMMRLEAQTPSTYLFRFDNGGTPTGGTVQCELNWGAGGTGRLRVHHGATTAVGPTAFLGATTYHVWFHCLRGTGANGLAEVHISTTCTKPGTPEATTGLTGAGALTYDAAVLQETNSTNSVVFDTVRVDDAPIGSCPP